MATKRRDKLSREVGVPLPWSIATEVSDAATLVVRRTSRRALYGAYPFAIRGKIAFSVAHLGF